MLHATIMAGGAGTRFWPASRKSKPKQLLRLTGEQSMLQSTIARLDGLCDSGNVWIVTNNALVDAISEQIPAIPQKSIIGEPAKRDTAPCIGLAAAWASAEDPDATMVVMPADHVISPDNLFQESIQHAVELVELDPGRIVTFGIKPAYPAEMFGYIERSATPLENARFPTFSVNRFREKPDLATAKEFLAAKSFYWNSGIFVWKAKTILEAIAEYEPKMSSHIQRIASSIGTDSYEQVLKSEFTAIEGTSIDYAVMEQHPNVLVVEAPFEWDDLGNWSAIPRLIGTDSNGNAVDGNYLGIGTENSIIRSENGHLIVTVGMKDCIVVHTPDATLIADRNNESEIKQVVAQLEQQELQQFL